MTEGEEDEEESHPGGGVTAGLGLSGLSDVGPASEQEEQEEEDRQAAALTSETEAQVACFACFTTSALLVQKYKYWRLSRGWPPTLLLCLHRCIYYIMYIICVIFLCIILYYICI
jgi:hypothetical protein